jgi:hypothetical protein
MKARRNFFLVVAAVLAVGFSVLFATVLQEWFRTAILAPLMRGFFLIRFYSLRLPQQLWWVAALLLAVALLVRMTLRALGPAPKRSQRGQSTGETVDELERLASLIDRAQFHPFYRQRVAGELARLAARLIARQEGVSVDQAWARLEAGTWGSDVLVQSLLREKRKRHRRWRKIRFNEELKHTLDVVERYSQGGC